MVGTKWHRTTKMVGGAFALPTRILTIFDLCITMSAGAWEPEKYLLHIVGFRVDEGSDEVFFYRQPHLSVGNEMLFWWMPSNQYPSFASLNQKVSIES